MTPHSRLDIALIKRGLATSRSQANDLLKLKRVVVNNKVVHRNDLLVNESDEISVVFDDLVSRAGLKLASVADKFGLNFTDKTVLDIGSSTGGFTDFALRHGAKKVIAVDIGTNQLHPHLRGKEEIELHEKTDIRDFTTAEPIDMIVSDVSFVSLREILPHVVKRLMTQQTQLIAMVKPQFEADKHLLNKGIVKNEKIRRQILGDFEDWARQYFVIIGKHDSTVAGQKGNIERFYWLEKLKRKQSIKR